MAPHHYRASEPVHIVLRHRFANIGGLHCHRVNISRTNPGRTSSLFICLLRSLVASSTEVVHCLASLGKTISVANRTQPSCGVFSPLRRGVWYRFYPFRNTTTHATTLLAIGRRCLKGPAATGLAVRELLIPFEWNLSLKLNYCTRFVV